MRYLWPGRARPRPSGGRGEYAFVNLIPHFTSFEAGPKFGVRTLGCRAERKGIARAGLSTLLLRPVDSPFNDRIAWASVGESGDIRPRPARVHGHSVVPPSLCAMRCCGQVRNQAFGRERIVEVGRHCDNQLNETLPKSLWPSVLPVTSDNSNPTSTRTISSLGSTKLGAWVKLS